MEIRKSGLLPTESPAVPTGLADQLDVPALEEPPESPSPRGGWR